MGGTAIHPVFESLEARVLFDAQGLAANAVDAAMVSFSAADDATDAFGWSGWQPVGGSDAARTTVLSYSFQGTPTIQTAQSLATVSLDGEQQWETSGEPVLPVRHSAILLPPGTSISAVTVSLGLGTTIASGLDLAAAPAAVALSAADPTAEAILQPVDSSFPADRAYTLTTQMLCGYQVLLLSVFPVQYDVDGKSLTYHADVSVEITVSASGELSAAPLRASADDLRRVLDLVDNDSAAADYVPIAAGTAPTAANLPDAGPYEYVLITSAELAGAFQPLVDHKISRGLSATVVTTEYIYANFAGTENGDNADRVRQFIQAAYAGWGTQWVLLGGDVDQVPHRGAYGYVKTSDGATVDENIPADIYFACLDGPWDGDGDGIWGESNDGAGGGDVDLAPEVFLGRAPVSTAVEATNFVNKTVLYETALHPHSKQAVWMGEALDDQTWGGDLKAIVKNDCIPAGWTVTERYEKDTAWTKADFIADLNASPHIVNHAGHASSTTNAKLTCADVDALTNEYPYFLYSWGCWSGSFDKDDSIGEHHVTAEHGAVAVIMNARFGWFFSGNGSDGPSHRYDLAFWDAVFHEDLTHFGEAHNDAKMDNLWRVEATGASRWLHFGITLLGDPETSFDEPAVLEGTVWNDADGDGHWDGDEFGLEGWRVYSDLNANEQWDTGEPFDITDGAGRYAVLVRPGMHVLRQEPQAGWLQTAPACDGPGLGSNEFVVNTFTSGEQKHSAVATAESGDFVVVWHSNQDADASYGIYAQRYRADGTPAGGEFRVNTTTVSLQSDPSVAMDAAGNFVVAWQGFSQAGRYDIYARRFAADGTALSGELLVNTTVAGDQKRPEIAMDAAGRFVIAWDSVAQDGDGLGVYARTFRADGTPAGGEFRVNAYTAGDQERPAVAMDNAGRSIIVWQSFAQEGASSCIYGRRFAADGSALGGEFRVSDRLDGNDRYPTVAADGEGGFVVAWTAAGRDGSGDGIFARLYRPDGLAVGGATQVNTHSGDSQWNPVASRNDAGQFAIVWTGLGQDGAGKGVFGQLFNADGTRDGEEFRVHSFTSGDQQNAAVAIDEAGRLVIAWDSDGQDSSGTAVVARQFAGFTDFGFHLVTAGLGETVENLRFANYPMPMPGRPDLLPASDTGLRDDDNLTRRNNGVSGSTLQFAVSDTVAGATVTLYVDGVALAGTVATGSTTVLTTGGDAVLSDGPHVVTASQTLPGMVESLLGEALGVTIDTCPPTPASAMAIDPAHVRVWFDEPVETASAQTVIHYTLFAADGRTITIAGAALELDGASVTLSLAEPMDASAGWTLSVVGVEDIAGNAAAADLGVDPQGLLARIQGRFVFYNRSKWDGNDPAANADDDNAIAIDKRPLWPGQTATFDNYTSYSRGINGIMIDIANASDAGALTADDFEFRVGRGGDPAGWQAAPELLEFVVRQGAGLDGSDRVTITWADNAIRGQWLQITVKANSHTGLQQPDVFYFGNAPGDTGDSDSIAAVDSGDRLGARANPRGAWNPAPIDDRYDFNRDGLVDSGDRLIARANATSAFTALRLITPPAAALPEGDPVPQPTTDPRADAAALTGVLPEIDPAPTAASSVATVPIASAGLRVARPATRFAAFAMPAPETSAGVSFAAATPVDLLDVLSLARRLGLDPLGM